MVKNKRNIYCTVCGKNYSDPIAAHQHARKHPKTDQPLVLVVPQNPRNVEVRSRGLIVYAEDTSVVYPSPSSQYVGPNVTDTTLGIPRAAAPPEVHFRTRARYASERGEELYCPLCPHLGKFRTKWDIKRHGKRQHGGVHKCPVCSISVKSGVKVWKHVKKIHGLSPTEVRGLAKKVAEKPSHNQDENIPDIPGYSSTESSDDEEHPFLEDGGQLLPEYEQRSPPEGKGKQPARDDRQAFGCDLCPETFLSAETLVMHTRAIHCWRCGYCRNLPPFSSVSLWREHRMMVHGLAE